MQPRYRAIKCLPRHGLDARQRHFQRREIALHRMACAHPSIVSLDKVIEDEEHIFVIMDYGEDGDLFAMITDKQRVSLDVMHRSSILIGLVSMLATTS